jgi:hypothetical protein
MAYGRVEGLRKGFLGVGMALSIPLFIYEEDRDGAFLGNDVGKPLAHFPIDSLREFLRL